MPSNLSRLMVLVLGLSLAHCGEGVIEPGEELAEGDDTEEVLSTEQSLSFFDWLNSLFKPQKPKPIADASAPDAAVPDASLPVDASLPPISNGVWLSGTYGEHDAFGAFRGTPVGIVGIGYNNAPNLELRGVISLDPKWTVSPDFKVLDSSYSLIDRSRGDTWASAARGALDALWRQGMQSVNASWGTRKWLFIRPAHELNGQDLWYVAPGEEADFKAAWIRFYNIVQDELVKKGKPVFLTFCVNHEKWGAAAEVSDALYPGDAFVDVIGVDYYDNKRHLDAASWEATARSTTTRGNPRGLYSWQAFAKRHGKPLALPEWGLQSETTPDNDNPFFIQKMNEFIRSNAGSGPGEVLYEQYFSAWDADRLNAPTFLPNSAAMYQSLRWSDGVGVAWPKR